MNPVEDRLPPLSLLAAFGAIVTALQLPLLEGSGDLIALVLACAAAVGSLVRSGRQPRARTSFGNWSRVGLLSVAALAGFLLTPAAREMFPAGRPLAAWPLNSLLGMLVVSAAFLNLPDGPTVTFALAGAFLVTAAFVDYGGFGPVTPLCFVFFIILFDLASLRSGESVDASEVPVAEHLASLFELSAGLTLTVGAAAALLYLGLPALLPEVDLERLASRIEARKSQRAGLKNDPRGDAAIGKDRGQGRGDAPAQGQQPLPMPHIESRPQPALPVAEAGQGQGLGSSRVQQSWLRQTVSPVGGTTRPGANRPANRSEAWLGDVRGKVNGVAEQVGVEVEEHFEWLLLAAAAAAALYAAGRRRLQRLARLVLRLPEPLEEGILTAAQARNFLEKLAAHGMIREPWETLHEFLHRLQIEQRPLPSLPPLIDLAVRVRYCHRPPGPEDRARASELLSLLDCELAAFESGGGS